MDTVYKVISIIEKNPFLYDYFKNCPYAVLKKWTVAHYQKKELIMRQGERCNFFSIMVNGLVDVHATGINGKLYSHAIYEKGNYLGELEIFEGQENCCSATALTDVEVLCIGREDFLRWVDTDKSIVDTLMRDMCRKFYTLSVKAAEDSFYHLKYRLCDFLLECVQKHEYIDKDQKLTIDKNALSSYLAVTGRSVNRVVRELRAKGILDVDSGYLVIHNLRLLKKELEQSK